MVRDYEGTHPWLTFRATDVNHLAPRVWMVLGEAKSKCEHLAGTPLRPDVAQRLYEMTLVKGALATVAIEGNTMTEAQADGIFRGTYKAPPSRAYQEREIRNVIGGLTTIGGQVMAGDRPTITAKLLREYNRQILDGTEYESHVVPGEFRDCSVAVPGYRGAPSRDCDFLVERLCEWIESDVFDSDDPEIRFALAVACAIYAHLYIAWIHPFGDKNGRTARLVEFLVLARCGMVPLPAAHLLSNHYNLTRDQYYRELADASRTKATTGFLAYAAQGLVDGIREQIDSVRAQQFDVTWTNYVHDTMAQFPSSPARERQRSLVLALPSGRTVSRGDLAGLTPKLASLYATAGPRTLARDLNRLRKVELVVKAPRGWQANDSIIRAFLPPMAADG